MSPHRPPAEDEGAELRRLYIGQQLSLAEIGDLWGLKRSAISALLNKYQIPARTGRRPRQMTPPAPEAAERVSALYVEGRMGIRRIAAMTTLSRLEVERILDAANIPRRGMGRPPAVRDGHTSTSGTHADQAKR